MSHTHQADLPKRRLLRLLPCLFGSLVFAGVAGAAEPHSGAQAQHAAAAPKAYRVVNLLPGGYNSYSTFNAKDQIAIGFEDETEASSAYFYDGRALRAIGNLGGFQTYVNGVNDAGEVAGRSIIANGVYHAFKWSRQGGIRDLGTLDGTGVSQEGGTEPINNRGQVVGFSSTQSGQTQAFLWSRSGGMRNLGGLPGNESGFSIATAINDAGMVVGRANAADGIMHASIWTPWSGMTDIDTLGGVQAYAVAISEDGLVAGNARTPEFRNHIFVWTRRGGLRDLGTLGAAESYVYSKPMSPNGNVVGSIRSAAEVDRAVLWTRTRGLVELGTLGGSYSVALGVNNKTQVVGTATATEFGTPSGFIWTARDGMIDLNTRLRNAPPGLFVYQGLVISESGVILAYSNVGLVLLKPDRGGPWPHAAGPITAPDMVEVGAPFDASVSFAAADTAARHNVSWSWGDGTGDQQVNPREGKGVGQTDGSHRYTAPGIYTVSVKVGDRNGQGPTVSRTVVVVERAAGTVGGNGWFESPAGANRKDLGQPGRATFSLFAPPATGASASAAKARLQFRVGTLNFRSENMEQVAAQATRAQFEGSGKINGAGDYRFRLSTTAGQGQPDRIGLKIWRIDPVTGKEVVSYDNEGARMGSAVPAAQGRIVLQQ